MGRRARNLRDFPDRYFAVLDHFERSAEPFTVLCETERAAHALRNDLYRFFGRVWHSRDALRDTTAALDTGNLEAVQIRNWAAIATTLMISSLYANAGEKYVVTISPRPFCDRPKIVNWTPPQVETPRVEALTASRREQGHYEDTLAAKLFDDGGEKPT